MSAWEPEAYGATITLGPEKVAALGGEESILRGLAGLAGVKLVPDEAVEQAAGSAVKRDATKTIDFGALRVAAERALRQALPVMLSPGELLALVEMAEAKRG